MTVQEIEDKINNAGYEEGKKIWKALTETDRIVIRACFKAEQEGLVNTVVLI